METSTAFGAKSYFFTYKIGDSNYLLEEISNYDKGNEEVKTEDAGGDKEIQIASTAAAEVHASSKYMDVKKVYCVYFEDDIGKQNIFLFLDGDTKKAISFNGTTVSKSYQIETQKNGSYIIDWIKKIYDKGEIPYRDLLKIVDSKEKLDKFIREPRQLSGLSVKLINIREEGLFKTKYISLTETGKRFANAIINKDGYMEIDVIDSDSPDYVKILLFESRKFRELYLGAFSVAVEVSILYNTSKGEIKFLGAGNTIAIVKRDGTGITQDGAISGNISLKQKDKYVTIGEGHTNFLRAITTKSSDGETYTRAVISNQNIVVPEQKKYNKDIKGSTIDIRAIITKYREKHIAVDAETRILIKPLIDTEPIEEQIDKLLTKI